jgi:hypothetical protein
MAYQRASSSNDVIHQRAFDMEPRATQVASKCCDAPISRSRPMRPDWVHDLGDQAIASVLRLPETYHMTTLSLPRNVPPSFSSVRCQWYGLGLQQIPIDLAAMRAHSVSF